MADHKKIAWQKLCIEAAAIVASILFAFAVDAWWEERNEIEREQRLLKSLLVEFEQNSVLLQDVRDRYEQQYLHALQILEHLDSGETDTEILAASLQGLLVGGTIHLETGVHDGLLASGELGLIRNEVLRDRLASWPTYVAEWSEEQASVFSYGHEHLVPYLRESIRIRSVAAEFLPFPDGEQPPRLSRIDSDATTIHDIVNSIRFDNIVYQRAQSLWYAMRDGETLLMQTTQITALLRQNINE